MKFLEMLLVVVLCNFLVKSMAFRQNDYTIKHHRLELISYNRTYVHDAKASLVPLNRTIRGLDIRFNLLLDLTQAIPFSCQAYRFASNEYRLFPFTLTFDFCKIQSENTFGTMDIAEFSNIAVCPIKKGTYHVAKYRPDESKFPPHMVPGDYKLVILISYSTDKVAEAHWYGSIKKIEKLWN